MDVLSSMTALLLTGEVFLFLGFVDRHPPVVWDILLFSVMSALGQVCSKYSYFTSLAGDSGERNLTALQWHYLFQLFIFVSVADFGPLPCSIITTTRKFFTVLGSVIIFGNRLIPRQWLGTCLVFSGLSFSFFCFEKFVHKEQICYLLKDIFLQSHEIKEMQIDSKFIIIIWLESSFQCQVWKIQ